MPMSRRQSCSPLRATCQLKLKEIRPQRKLRGPGKPVSPTRHEMDEWARQEREQHLFKLPTRR